MVLNALRFGAKCRAIWC